MLSDFDTNLVLSQHNFHLASVLQRCDLLSDFDTNLVLSQLNHVTNIEVDGCDLLSDFDTNLVLSQQSIGAYSETSVVICFQILILT